MKKNLLTHLLILAGTFSAVITSNAQSITVVPNPNAPGTFAWTGFGPLSGYSGTPIILKNSLVVEYNSTSTSDTTRGIGKQQLAVYNGGDSLHLIPNPDGGQVIFQDVQLVHNDSLFFIYLDASGFKGWLRLTGLP